MKSVFRNLVSFALAAASTSTLPATANFGLMLSDAADYLAREGMDPAQSKEFVRTMSGTEKVRVLQPDGAVQFTLALKQAMADASRNDEDDKYKALMRFMVDMMQNERGSRDLAYAMPVTNKLVRDVLDADCLIRPVGSSLDDRQVLSLTLQSPPNIIEDTFFKGKELTYLTIGHEMAHCASQNLDAPDEMKEVDADIHLMTNSGSGVLDKGSFSKLAYVRVLFDMCSRSPRVPTAHSTGLFIDAMLNGQSMTWGQAMPVYEKSISILKKFRDAAGADTLRAIPCFVATGAIYKIALDDNSPDLSPLTRHYMDMAIKGAEALAPNAFANAVSTLRQKQIYAGAVMTAIR